MMKTEFQMFSVSIVNKPVTSIIFYMGGSSKFVHRKWTAKKNEMAVSFFFFSKPGTSY